MYIKNCCVKVLCEKHHREVEVYIRCVFSNHKLIIAECNGCDSGYNASDECIECTNKCLKVFLQNRANNQ